MMCSSVLLAWLPLVGLTGFAPATDHGNEFSHAITALADAGWHIAQVDVDEPALGVDGPVRLSLTMSNSQVAQRHTVAFSADGDSVVDYTRSPVPASEQRRFYRNEEEIVVALAIGRAASLHYECASYFLGVGRRTAQDEGAVIDPDDYYVLETTYRGQAARRAIGIEVRRAVAQSRTLVDLRPAAGTRAGEQHGVELVFSRKDERVLRIGLDRRDRVVSLEVQRSPYRDVLQRYPSRRARRLGRALAGSRTVDTVRWARPVLRDEDEPVPLILELSAGRPFTIRPDHFGPGDLECPC